jgi:hypothetical protein
MWIRRFGQPQHPAVYGIEPERDDLEIDLLLEADSTHVPVLAICRGLQVVNVAFGGTLHQHLPDVPRVDEHRAPEGRAALMHEVNCTRPAARPQWRLLPGTIRASIAWAKAWFPSPGRETAWSRRSSDPRGGWLPSSGIPRSRPTTDPAQQALFDAFAMAARG